MPENQAILLGRAIGSIESLTEATKSNTAQMLIFNAYMHKAQGIAEEREKQEARERRKIRIHSGGIAASVTGFIQLVLHLGTR